MGKQKIISGFEEREDCFIGGAFVINESDNEPDNKSDIDDYDEGLLNDYGGGNVQWWQDYIRNVIQRCNYYWREQIKGEHTEK